MDDRLQKFARLTEIGSFTRAAKELHISQPALSIAIDKLERELGAELLIRSSKKFELTESGQAAYQAALDHQSTTDHLQTVLSRIAKKRPAVVIGMIDSVAAVLCATPAFEVLEAAADVTVVVNNSRYLREALERRRLDAIFSIDDGVEHPTLLVEPVGTDELVVVCNPKVATTATVELNSSRLSRFISYDKPSTTYRHIQQTLQAKGVKTQTVLFSTSPAIMLDLSVRGKGVAALPRLLVNPHLTDGSLIALVHNGELLRIERPVCIAQLRGKTQTPVLQAFLDATRSQKDLEY